MSVPTPSDDVDDDVVDILGTKEGENSNNNNNGGKTNGNNNNNNNNNNNSAAANAAIVTSRARRRREEAVRRLVGDVHRRPDPNGFTGGTNMESHEWLVASTVATALERGLDKDLHSELVQEGKENSARIGQVCHDHSDAFLASVAKVVALGVPSGDLSDSLGQADGSLRVTADTMLEAAASLEHAKQANQRARTLAGMVTACRNVAVLLERARKQASLGRPRAALDAVDEARNCLTAPVTSLLLGAKTRTNNHNNNNNSANGNNGPNGNNNNNNKGGDDGGTSTVVSLEETPFGQRAMVMLPKIENEVLMGARRGLNRWFLALRSGGDGAKAGRAVLRKCAHSMAVGPGQLGLGGHLPPSYIWRAKVADNLLARLDQNGKVARAVRLGYWFDRDGPKEAERLDVMAPPGMKRRAEAFAAAFGWYRCWDENALLYVDVTELNVDQGLSGSRHGGSRHGGSRHGKNKGNLSFRGTQARSGAQGRRELTLGGGKGSNTRSTTSSKGGGGQSSWAPLLTPAVLFENASSR